MAELSHQSRSRQRKLASRVLFGICIAWITVMLVVQFSQAIHHGYGSGFGDGKRLPPELVERLGVPNDVAAVVKAGTVPVSQSVAEDTVRLLFSGGVLVALVAGWYWLLSRLGSF